MADEAAIVGGQSAGKRVWIFGVIFAFLFAALIRLHGLRKEFYHNAIFEVVIA